MEQIPKSFLSLLIMVVFVLAGVSIMTISLQANEAQSFTSKATSMIEQYNFSENIVQSCIDEAKEKGYEMKVSLYDTNQDGRNDMAYIKTIYQYSLKILGLHQLPLSIETYAR